MVDPKVRGLDTVVEPGDLGLGLAHSRAVELDLAGLLQGDSLRERPPEDPGTF